MFWWRDEYDSGDSNGAFANESTKKSENEDVRGCVVGLQCMYFPSFCVFEHVTYSKYVLVRGMKTGRR